MPIHKFSTSYSTGHSDSKNFLNMSPYLSVICRNLFCQEVIKKSISQSAKMPQIWGEIRPNIQYLRFWDIECWVGGRSYIFVILSLLAADPTFSIFDTDVLIWFDIIPKWPLKICFTVQQHCQITLLCYFAGFAIRQISFGIGKMSGFKWLWSWTNVAFRTSMCCHWRGFGYGSGCHPRTDC